MPLCRAIHSAGSATTRVGLLGLAAVVIALGLLAASKPSSLAGDNGPIVYNTLDIAIDPPAARLDGTATITVPAPVDDMLVFHLSPRAVVSRVQLLSVVPETITVAPGRFTVDGEAFDAPGDALFCVFQHPVTEGKTAALFFPLSGGGAASAVRKITHCGRYSYLVFSDGGNRIKSTWPVIFSPMEYFLPVPDDGDKQDASRGSAPLPADGSESSG